MEDYEQLNEVVEENEQNDFLFAKQKADFNEITDSFKFKSQLIKVSELIEDLMSSDILNANFTESEKKLANNWLGLANSCIEREYLDTARSYVRDTLCLAGISRGYKGFQQEKFVETRDVREARVQTPRKRGFWGRGQ